MLDVRNIRSLTDFQRNARKAIRALKRTGLPQVLTVNGEAELVVQDAESYQKLLAAVERAEAIAGIKAGLDSFAQGRGIPIEKSLKRIR